jgi:hypothetical protein
VAPADTIAKIISIFYHRRAAAFSAVQRLPMETQQN